MMVVGYTKEVADFLPNLKVITKGFKYLLKRHVKFFWLPKMLGLLGQVPMLTLEWVSGE